MIMHSTMSVLKFTHRVSQSPDTFCPGQISVRRGSAEQFSRARESQHVQNLLLDRIQLGELGVEQTAIGSPDKNNTVVSKGLQDARHGRPEIVPAFRHQAADWLLSFCQCPANLAFNQARNQAANHDQEDQTDNPLWFFQEQRSDTKKLVGQAEAIDLLRD